MMRLEHRASVACTWELITLLISHSLYWPLFEVWLESFLLTILSSITVSSSSSYFNTIAFLSSLVFSTALILVIDGCLPLPVVDPHASRLYSEASR